MSPRYVASDIDEVRERADIVEVVGEHVRLRRAGRVWKGLCPFHQEKTPSFSVDRDKGVYYCFGCSEGGSVFTFIEKTENLSFPEAVEVLARRYGVELRETGTPDKRVSPRARLIEMHDLAVEFYEKTLRSKDGAAVRDYLDERGLSLDACERYRVGFGGWSREALVRSLLRRGFRSEEIMQAGLATRDGRGMRDMFYGRVLFPIFDVSDKPVGFGGRVVPEAFRAEGGPDGPKYLNSRETPLFRKSKTLYGLNWARGHALAARRLVLVEGYTDVIALHEAGIGEAVATCGTSLTEQHMQEISRRFGDVRIVLCLDADAAGMNAVARERTEELASGFSPGGSVAGGGWLPVGKGWLPEVLVARLPQGQDPADFVAGSGAEAVSDVLEKAIPLVEFLLRVALDGQPVRTPDERARAARRGADVLADVGDSLLRHEYALWLSDRIGVDAYEVVKMVRERAEAPAGKRTRPQPRQADQPAAQTAPLTGPQRIEREALRALLSMDQLFKDELVEEEDFSTPAHRALFRLLATTWDDEGAIDASRLADRVQDDQLRRIVTELAVGGVDELTVGREVLRRVKEMSVARRIDDLKGRLRELDPEREAQAYDAMFESLLTLEKQRRALTAET